jgi:uncharacterized protein with NAD-binding domain and iron-sulfur cluster
MTNEPLSATPSATRTRVAIVGGGPGGISAAFWLTSTPQLRAKFDVTVYTPGWRLGGKCATGRNLGIGARIQEHGLHILMGCYRHAFRTIRSCYKEWRPRSDCPFKTWKDAFSAQREITLEEPVSGSNPVTWTSWNFVLPRLPGQPGDGAGTAAASVSAACAAEGWQSRLDKLVASMASWLSDLMQNSMPPDSMGTVDYQAALQRFRKLVLRRVGDPDEVQLALEQVALRVRYLISVMPIAAARSRASANAISLPHSQCPQECVLVLADLGLSIAIGWLRDVFGRTDRGINHLNDLDFRQWLKHCGATPAALASAPIRAVYDLTFAFRNGDGSSIDNGSIAAGVTLRFVLEATLGYRNAPLWKMNAGTGDTVFTPFYQVLRARGVRINFFQRVTGIGLTDDLSKIGTITLDRQARVITGDYQPFVNVAHLDCWPDQPLWDQLEHGPALCAQQVNFESPADYTVVEQHRLTLGCDFDVVVLAVPPEVAKTLTPQLSDQCARWRSMLDHSASVATRAFQLWLRPTLAKLGWNLGPTVLTAFAEPFDSWADLSHLLDREAWDTRDPPHAVEYFCGCQPNSSGPDPDPAKDAKDWLARWISTLWPAAAPPGGPINSGLLVSSYYRSNLHGSDRYVQTPAGSVRYRLSPATAIFSNLYLAGDWTLTRFSGGCFESAIESGMLAAAAIGGDLRIESNAPTQG